MVITITIIIIAGILGGLANYYMEQANGSSLYKSVLLGLTASATVPLLLNTLSSNLTEKCVGGDHVSYFVFFGFCTVSAIFSSKFLQTLGDKLLQELKDVKKKQDELSDTTDVLVAQNSDPSDSPAAATPAPGDGSEFESFKGGSASTSAQAGTMSEEQKILTTLQRSTFAFRTVEGIAKDAGLDLALVQSKLLELELQGKVKKTNRKRDGVMVWSLR
ncbi:MAG: YEATS-associated helix-containing protein [Saprospiraceae bacterium]